MVPAPDPNPDLEPMAGRLRAAVEAAAAARSCSQNAIAKMIPVASGTLSSWLTAVYPPSAEGLARIAKLSGFSGDYLLGLAKSPRPEAPKAGPEAAKAQRWTYLPKVGWTAAGEPIDYTVPEDEFTWYAFHRSWAEQMTVRDAPDDQQRLVMIEVGEDQESMWPTLRPGAVLVVDRGVDGRGIQRLEDVRQGRVYLCQIPGTPGVTAKYVSVDRQMGLLILSSDNPDREKYPPKAIPLRGLELQRVLVGLVIHVGQDLAPRRRNPKRHGDAKAATKEHLVGLVEKAGGKAK